MAKILIVEDELSISNLILKNLELVGHRCNQVFDGQTAVETALKTRYDLMILDVMLPGLSGFEIIERLDNTPVIFVTAKGSIEDRLKGLKLGGDDYITKPFSALELVARVDAVLRRTNSTAKKLEFDDISVDFTGRKVYKNGEVIPLKPKEFELLEIFLRNRNIALSREKLISLAWGYDFAGDTRTVDVHIQQIRKKLGLENRIQTVYKTGYRFEL